MAFDPGYTLLETKNTSSEIQIQLVSSGSFFLHWQVVLMCNQGPEVADLNIPSCWVRGNGYPGPPQGGLRLSAVLGYKVVIILGVYLPTS